MRVVADIDRLQKTTRRTTDGLRAIRQTLKHLGTGEVVVSKRKKLAHERGQKRRPLRDPSIPAGIFSRRVTWVTGMNGARQRDTFLRDARGRIQYEAYTIKVMHGRAIANFLRSKGHDPFDYKADATAFANRLVMRGLRRAQQVAWGSANQERRIVRNSLEGAAQYLADWARSNIIEGHLGQKRPLRVARHVAERGVSSADLRVASAATVIGRRSTKARALVRAGFWTDRYGLPPPYGIATGRFVEGIRGRWRLGRQGRRR